MAPPYWTTQRMRSVLGSKGSPWEEAEEEVEEEEEEEKEDESES